MTNKTYNAIKISVTIVLPALGTAYGVIGNTWGLPYTEPILTTVTAVVTAGAVILRDLSQKYHQNEKGELEENTEEEG